MRLVSTLPNGKSTVTIFRSHTETVVLPVDVPHTVSGMKRLVEIIRHTGSDAMVFMEHTVCYCEPVGQTLALNGFPVAAFNPLLSKGYGSNSLHHGKTDKADARKIARYGLDYW